MVLTAIPRTRFYALLVELDLRPVQPPDIARAIAEALSPPAPEPDPWWREGIEEALYGETTALPRSTLGADLA